MPAQYGVVGSGRLDWLAAPAPRPRLVTIQNPPPKVMTSGVLRESRQRGRIARTHTSAHDPMSVALTAESQYVSSITTRDINRQWRGWGYAKAPVASPFLSPEETRKRLENLKRMMQSAQRAGDTGSGANAVPQVSLGGVRSWPSWLVERSEFRDVLASSRPQVVGTDDVLHSSSPTASPSGGRKSPNGGKERSPWSRMSDAERQSRREADLIRACSKPGDERTKAEILNLSKFLAEQPFTVGFDVLTIEKLACTVSYTTAAPGEAIVTQGDLGDAFYILIGGTPAVVEVRKLGVVAHVPIGGAFGELALTIAERRQATVRAGNRGARLLKLTRQEYQDVLAAVHARWVDTLMQFLSEQKLLAGWSGTRLKRLAMIVGVHNVNAGEIVVRQGADADKLYFLRVGTAVIEHAESVPGADKWPVSKHQMAAAELARTELEAKGRVRPRSPAHASDDDEEGGRDGMGSNGFAPGLATRYRSLSPTKKGYNYSVEWAEPRYNEEGQMVSEPPYGHAVRRTVLSTNAVIGELGPGACYGLAYVASGAPHAFTLRARSRCQFIFIHAKYLKPNAVAGQEVLDRLKRQSAPKGALSMSAREGRPSGHTEGYNRAAADSRHTEHTGFPLAAGGSRGSGGTGDPGRSKVKHGEVGVNLRYNLLDTLGPRDLGGTAGVVGEDNEAGPSAAATRVRAVTEGTATLSTDPDDELLTTVVNTLASHGVKIYEDAAYYLKTNGARIQGQQTQAMLRRRRTSITGLAGMLTGEDCEHILKRMMTRLDDDARAQRKYQDAVRRNSVAGDAEPSMSRRPSVVPEIVLDQEGEFGLPSARGPPVVHAQQTVLHHQLMTALQQEDASQGE